MEDRTLDCYPYVVHYEYTPATPHRLTGNQEADRPGDPPSVRIVDVTIKGESLINQCEYDFINLREIERIVLQYEELL